MSDLGPVYVLGASAGLITVVAFLAYLSHDHEKQKMAEPERAKSRYGRASQIGLAIAGGGGLVAFVGVTLSEEILSWFGTAVIDGGVLAASYAILGYQDIQTPPAQPPQSEKRTTGRMEKLLGTSAVVAGLVTFLSWGLDFIAFPALGVTVALVVAWLAIKTRFRTPIRRP